MMYIEGLVERRKNKEWLGWRLEMSMDRISGCFDPAGIECLAAALPMENGSAQFCNDCVSQEDGVTLATQSV